MRGGGLRFGREHTVASGYVSDVVSTEQEELIRDLRDCAVRFSDEHVRADGSHEDQFSVVHLGRFRGEGSDDSRHRATVAKLDCSDCAVAGGEHPLECSVPAGVRKDFGAAARTKACEQICKSVADR